MIPKHLSLSGFLSYREPVDLDFSRFELACISGQNGAGKSSLLDAITWSIFGQARRRDDAVINAASETAEVSLTFEYESNTYRVQRIKPRNKTTILEFHIQTADESWKPLTERTLRETEAKIQDVLRLDYETFINASFFLQGKADQFTQQRAGDRKRILGTILGLEVWETYRKRTVEHRKVIDAHILSLEGRLQEIKAELDEEGDRVERLNTLEVALDRLAKTRSLHETALSNLRRQSAALREQENLINTLADQLHRAERNLEEIETRHASRKEERDSFASILSRSEEIDKAYSSWETARAELERWEQVASQFHEHEVKRHAPLTEIETVRSRLEIERDTLKGEASNVESTLSEVPGLEGQIATEKQVIEAVNAQISERFKLEGELDTARTRQAEAKAENPRLKGEMDELKDRIDQLTSTEGATCPLCGQPLDPDDRQRLIEELNVEGKVMGDRFRENKKLLDEFNQLVEDLEKGITSLKAADANLREHTRNLDQLTAHLEQIQNRRGEWEALGAVKLKGTEAKIESGDFAQEARAILSKIDAELIEIGYDTTAHDSVRENEGKLRSVEEDLRALEKARATLAPLEREIAETEEQIGKQRGEISRLQNDHDQAAASFAAAQAELPDLDAAERDFLTLQEEENSLRLEVGAAQQKVSVLEDLKVRRLQLDTQREELARKVAQYRALERAFGKDGVPAMLIEQALPQIELTANEVLQRLSGGNMSIRFSTQQAYKDKKRTDLRETLDIQISDGAGIRDYEMFSGGEAFRINFAIRLALSEVLAQRAGASLQTLVIDEGFGSQDDIGRQRLVEAINLVKDDFAKILVITHIDSLKDAFDTRIEVTKTPQGSVIQVV
jgi:exonuclease SbcC